MLALSGISVGYGAVTAVAGIDLTVGQGEIFCLLGGSGSGKTTLLRCIGGFLVPSAGTIGLAGQNITGQPPHRRDMTTLFQSYALFPHMNVADNIAFGLRRRGMRDVAGRVAEMLALVRLDGMERRRIAELSGGQQQRVALARCLAPNPRLLLLDEPLSALDPELRAATRADLVDILRAQGITAILVTHDRAEALAVADRIGLLHQGRMAQIGTPEQLYEHPANRFVAGFLGDAVFLDAVVRESGADTLLDFAGGQALCGPSAHSPGTRLTLALRPERIRLVHDTGVNRLAGTVASLTYAGAAIEIGVALAGGTLLRLFHPAEKPRPMIGEDVLVGWDTAMVLPG